MAEEDRDNVLSLGDDLEGGGREEEGVRVWRCESEKELAMALLSFDQNWTSFSQNDRNMTEPAALSFAAMWSLKRAVDDDLYGIACWQ